mmetsp:Transcript_29657/g.59323  ORF Transcript_29657/g.59323 Transcript_29657/m.59323 type:complete len:674 (-) Transcript_29657:26-2047(-)
MKSKPLPISILPSIFCFFSHLIGVYPIHDGVFFSFVTSPKLTTHRGHPRTSSTCFNCHRPPPWFLLHSSKSSSHDSHRISISFTLRCPTALSSAPTSTHPHPESSSSSLPTNNNDPLPIQNPLLANHSTAIVLNTNARSVTPELVSIASQVFGEEHVYVTSTFDDAKMAAGEVVRKKYKLVVPVGGDGTLSGWINGMVDEILSSSKAPEERGKDVDDVDRDSRGEEAKTVGLEEAIKVLPVMGYIPMGTGNGLGYVIGCRVPKAKLFGNKRNGSVLSDLDEKDLDGASDNGTQTKRGKIKRALSTFGSLIRRKKRRLEQTREVMQRLKEVGNDIHLAEDDFAREDILAGKCSIVEMSLMEVTHHSKDAVIPAAAEGGTVPDIDGRLDNLKGDLCFFAGAGFDSLMLHDFQQLKAWSSSSRHLPVIVKDALSSVAGYCVALVTKTLPQTLKYGTHNIHVSVTTPDEDTLWIDHRRGDFAELAIPSRERQNQKNHSAIANEKSKHGHQKQHLIFRGTAGILSASTAPFYGGGMKLFPYASLFPNKLQLRLGRISPLTGFFNIPKIFEGSYREKSEGEFGCLDFIGEDFEVEVASDRYDEYLEREKEVEKRRWFQKKETSNIAEKNGSNNAKKPRSGFPFQHSGESMGCKERFRLRVIKEPVKFISFLEPRVIIDE